MKFKLESKYKAIPDQEEAVKTLTERVLCGDKYQTLLGVTGSGKSVDYNDPVLLKTCSYKSEFSLIKIGNFVDKILKNNTHLKMQDSEIVYTSSLKNNYEIYTINPTNGNLEYKRITALIRHQAPKSLYRITTSCGRQITVTKDHNLWVLRNGQLTLIKTLQAREGDFLPVPRNLGFLPKGIDGVWINDYLDQEKIYFNLDELIEKISIPKNILTKILGKKYWRATVGNERVNISFLKDLLKYKNLSLIKNLTISPRIGNKSTIYLSLSGSFLNLLGTYIAEGCTANNYLILSVHETEAKKILFRTLKSLNINYKERKTHKGDFQVNNSILVKLFKIFCGNGSANKHLPPWFFNLNKRQMSKILSAYFDGDGYVNKAEVGITTKSRELAMELMYALSIFDIVTRYRKIYKRATNSNMKKQLYYEIIISGQNNIDNFREFIGFNLKRKNYSLLSTFRVNENTNVDLIPINPSELEHLRENANISQAELAKTSNCSRSLISMIEDGKRLPSQKTCRNILDSLQGIIKQENDFEVLNKYYSYLKIFWTPIKDIKNVKPSTSFVYDFSVDANETFLAGFGGIFVHNTFTMANVIENVQRPTLIISHNKTLAAQLYQELRDFFPKNAVSYFVSYYDYYQPEAYIPSTDTYIEKDADINETIDKLRLAATTNLLTRSDTIVVASVSCIYNIGSPREYGHFVLEFAEGMKIGREQIIDRIVDLQYERSDFGFNRGTFRVRGNAIDIYPAYLDEGVHIEFDEQVIKKVEMINPVSGSTVEKKEGFDPSNFILYPAKHFMTDPAAHTDAFDAIRTDLEIRVAQLKKEGKLLEAHRIAQKVTYDLEMIQEVGYVKGIENYSRYFDGRNPGDAPFSLLDYFNEPYKDKWLLLVDESHMTFPQIRGMFNGDLARKQTLIDYGFRLPSALDNRPLRFEEFIRRVPNFIASSATPNEWEVSMSGGKTVEILVRPTGIPDPLVEIRPVKNQVADVITEIKKVTAKKQRTLVTTLTKRTAEDLTTYLNEQGLKVQYLHSDVATLDRGDILDDLRNGKYDVLVGINLLREGLDLPEVSLVAILDADKEGFLRSDVTLIQTMGRAARHVEGRVIMYANKVTGSMERALSEVKRRRKYQIAYNEKHHITPVSITKPIRERIIENEQGERGPWVFGAKEPVYASLPNLDVDAMTPMEKKRLIKNLQTEMRLSAQDLNFELAAQIRDKIRELV